MFKLEETNRLNWHAPKKVMLIKLTHFAMVCLGHQKIFELSSQWMAHDQFYDFFKCPLSKFLLSFVKMATIIHNQSIHNHGLKTKS